MDLYQLRTIGTRYREGRYVPQTADVWALGDGHYSAQCAIESWAQSAGWSDVSVSRNRVEALSTDVAAEGTPAELVSGQYPCSPTGCRVE